MLDPLSVLVGIAIGIVVAEVLEWWVERRARNKRMYEAAVEKRQC